jgi:anti-sigma-K factor RskA
MTEMHDWVGAYAVDALDDPERDAFERHLAECPACSEELAGYREVLASVADTQAVVPPAGAWEGVARRIGGGDIRDKSPVATTSDADTVASHAGGSDTGASATGASATGASDGARRSGRPVLRWFAAAAAAAVLFVGGVLVGRQMTPEVPVAADPSVVSVLEVAAAGDARFTEVDMMGSRSRVVTSGEMDKSVFIAADLPTPAKGMCYQVWRVNDDGSKESAGVFVPDEQGHVAVVLDGGADVASYVITLEPPGGSKAPTGEMVAQVGA